MMTRDVVERNPHISASAVGRTSAIELKGLVARGGGNLRLVKDGEVVGLIVPIDPAAELLDELTETGQIVPGWRAQVAGRQDFWASLGEQADDESDLLGEVLALRSDRFDDLAGA